MSQFDFGNLESPLSGTALINSNLEPWRDALNSLHSGSTRPSYAVAGIMWLNTTTNPWVLNVFDGTDDIPLGTINTSTNAFTPNGVVNLLPLNNTFTGTNIFQGVVDVTNINAETSAGGKLRTSGGTDCIGFGAGGSANATMFGNLSMGTTHKIVNMADPTADQDAATKKYVDDEIAAIPTTDSQQICKAWISFDGTGTIAINESFGVSSIVDDGTGLYTINFSINFANTNYVMAGSAGGGANNQLGITYGTTPVKAVGSCQIRVVVMSNGAAQDASEVNVMFFGDQ